MMTDVENILMSSKYFKEFFTDSIDTPKEGAEEAQKTRMIKGNNKLNVFTKVSKNITQKKELIKLATKVPVKHIPNKSSTS